MQLRAILFLFLALGATACSYTLPIKDGQTAYERKRFADAIPMLEKEFSSTKTRAQKGRLAYLIADSYARTGRAESALEWYKTAYDNNGGPDALRGYAFSLKKLQRYADAREAFKNLGIEIGSPYEYRKEITACTVAEAWLKEVPTNGISVSAAPFNSPDHDFAPTWAPDGRLIFSSDRAAATGKDRYGWTGHAFMDLFIVDADAASAQAFDPLLNSTTHEATPCFSKNGQIMWFVRTVGAYEGDDEYCKIYEAERVGDSWANPKPLPFQKEKINYLHPALGPDGNTLYFAANDPEGWGGYDLYSVTRQPNSETGWGEPRPLSRNLNTPGNELFPAFDADTLYFASDGLTGMGGLDVFRSYRIDRAGWAPPINLKSPINSGGDDFGLIFIKKNNETDIKPAQPGDLLRTGFLTSNRAGDGTRGGDDIFRFEMRVPPPRRDTTPTKPPATQAARMDLDIFVVEKIYADPANPNSKVLGKRPLAQAKLVRNLPTNGGTQALALTDGYVSLLLAPETDYQFTARCEGYLTNSAKFSTRGIAPDPSRQNQTFELEIVLDRIFRDREITLENIYYDYDKSDIRPDAEPTLNQLALMLTQNPDIRIALGSHTDCRGNDGYNQKLSQARAESAVAYLIGRGIAPDRLSAVGYGEQVPADLCACARCSEEQHQANRRTTFRIVN
jgi:peptidoglycan-associated lipoprotein